MHVPGVVALGWEIYDEGAGEVGAREDFEVVVGSELALCPDVRREKWEGEEQGGATSIVDKSEARSKRWCSEDRWDAVGGIAIWRWRRMA